jgi:hypothetical protein
LEEYDSLRQIWGDEKIRHFGRKSCQLAKGEMIQEKFYYQSSISLGRFLATSGKGGIYTRIQDEGRNEVPR